MSEATPLGLLMVLDRPHARSSNGTNLGRNGDGKELGKENTGGNQDAGNMNSDTLADGSGITLGTSSYKLVAQNTGGAALTSSQPSIAYSTVALNATSSIPTGRAGTATPYRLPQESSNAVRIEIGTALSPIHDIATQVNDKSPAMTALPSSVAIVLLVGDSELDSNMLPGMNQDPPKLDALPQAMPGPLLGTPGLPPTPDPTIAPAKPGAQQPRPPMVPIIAGPPMQISISSSSKPSAPVATVVRPMPGKNQPKPAMDDAAAASFRAGNGLAPLPTPVDPASVSQTQSISLKTSTAPLPSTMLVAMDSLPSLLSASSSSTSLSRSDDLQSTLVTLTKMTLSIQQAPVTFNAVSNSDSATQFGLLSAMTSSTIVATTLMATPTVFPSLIAAASAAQSSRLTPLARTLFITFGVLGAVTLLIALGIILMIRGKRKSLQKDIRQRPADDTGDMREDPGQYRVTSTVEDDEFVNDNPFLTESEKAIVTRAVSPDGEPSSKTIPAGTRFTDAINSFIAKSRRLTYKLSP